MPFGSTQTDNIGTPLGSVYVPNTAGSDLTPLQGGPASTDGNGKASAPVATYTTDGNNLALGAKADAAASTDTGTFSLLALFKRLLSKIPALGQATKSASLPVTLATDQGAGSVSGTLQTAQTGNANGTPLAVLGMAACVFTVTVSGFTGTVNFEGTEDGTNWSALLVVASGSTTTSTTATGAGQFVGSCAGLQQVRARTSGVSAGSVTVTAHAVSTPATNVATGGGGGGGGTSSSYGAAFPAVGTAAGAKDASNNMAPLLLDANGNLKATLQAAGSDGVTASSYSGAAKYLYNGATLDRAQGKQGVQDVSSGGRSSTAIAAGTAGNTVVKASAGRLASVLVTTTGTNPLVIYDNASTASGTIIGALPASPAIGLYVFGTPAQNGLTVAGNASNPGVTVFYF